MKKIIFFLTLLVVSLLGTTVSYAGEDHNRLCTYSDGLYGNEYFQVAFPGYVPHVNNIVKAKNKLYYAVYAQKEFAENIQEAGLYEYNCTTKKAKELHRIANRTWGAPMEWEIDGFDGRFIIFRELSSGSPWFIGIYDTQSTWENKLLINLGIHSFWEDSNRKSRKFIPLDMVDSITYMQYLDFKPTSIGKGRVLVRLYFDKDRKQFSEKWYDYNMFKMSLTK